MNDINSLVKPRLTFMPTKLNILRLISVGFVGLIFSPWIAFTVGNGQITAINPNERVQTITAPIGGFIKTWHVNEGDMVEEGQLIADLIDNDPSLLERLARENDAAKTALASAQLMMETAKIDYSKHSVEYSKNLAVLTKSETQLSRQSTQRVFAPRKGTITRIISGERGMLIKAGNPILVFAPEVRTPAVELWVDGNDASMIRPGQTAELQFEGWPALQIAGWPSIAIGTFKGKVHLVDQASSHDGKFRVLLVPVSKWPSQNFLRLGVHAKGYIRLKGSFVFREIWRQLNGFPPVLGPVKDELNKMLSNKVKDSEEDKDKK